MSTRTFRKITTSKRYLQVAEQILEYIRSGALAIGSQLPSERELAAQMGVSRPTVREALLALELLSVVEVRLGQGTYVVGTNGVPFMSLLETGEPSPFSVFEARVVIESSTAALSAKRLVTAVRAEETGRDLGKGDKSFDRAVAVADAMKQSVDDLEQIDEFYQLGCNFHKAVAACSANAILEEIIGRLVDSTKHPLWAHLSRKVLRERQVRQSQIDEHERILQALRQGDDNTAAVAMHDHLMHFTDIALC